MRAIAEVGNPARPGSMPSPREASWRAVGKLLVIASRWAVREYFSAQLSLKIVNGDLFDVRFYVLRHKLEMLRMDLVIVLGLFAGEGGVQGDLITLVHDGARTARHFPDMELHDAGDVFEELIGAGHDFIRRIGISRVRPENDNMREHVSILNTPVEFGYRFGERDCPDSSAVAGLVSDLEARGGLRTVAGQGGGKRALVEP